MERACKNLEIPGAVLFASNASGKYHLPFFLFDFSSRCPNNLNLE